MLTATVGAAAYPSVTNTATVSSTDPDLPGSATASDPVVVDPSATLQLSKQHLGTFAVGAPGELPADRQQHRPDRDARARSPSPTRCRPG